LSMILVSWCSWCCWR